MADTAPYHDRDGFIWYDGRLVAWREAGLHVLSHALHYASAVFEGERAYGGEIFELTKHSQRLYDGAKVMDFTIPYSVAEIDQACRDTVKANKLTDCYVRPIAWRGSEQMGVSAQATKIHLAVAAWDWGSYFPMEEEKDNRVFGAMDGAIRGNMFRQVQERWMEWQKLFLSIIPFPEISAARAMPLAHLDHGARLVL